MIKVTDNTLVDFERHRKITIDGTEREIDQLVDALCRINTRTLPKSIVEVLRDFTRSLENACCW